MSNYLTQSSKSQHILKFVETFRSKHPDFQYLFTNGLCYHFAAILKNIFFGDIVYNDIDNHFAFDDGYNVLDITGIIDREGFQNWDKYNRQERLNSERVANECILLYNANL